MPENYPQDNTPDIGPIEGEFNFVLRRTDREMWPWRQAFYNSEPAVARDVTHADGVRAPTFFVTKWVHRMVLYRLGWVDVTASWNEAIKHQWKHGDNEPGENWWKRNDEPEVESVIPALNEPEDTPLLDPVADADAIANATITDADGNEVKPNEDGTPIEGTPLDDFDPGDDFDDDDDEPDEPEPFGGDEQLREISGVGAEPEPDANDWPKTWADIVALDYSGDPSLQSHLKAFDLKASGTKGDLRARLAEHLKIAQE